MSRVLAVASGKGGTGKTSLSVNLAVALGRMGRRVCLLDADLGLSNVDVVLGISPQTTLEHVLFEGVPMERAIVRVGENLDVVPGGSGVARLADLPPLGRKALAEGFSRLSGYDYLIVDGSPGISGQVISLCLACPELLVVVNPDPSSVTDAYALVKVLGENGMRKSPWVLLNRVKSAHEADGVFSRLRAAMGKYLRLDARLLGHVPQDPHMAAAAARQRPLAELYPASVAGRAVLGLARTLDQARLPAGTASADPTMVMGGAMARMRELAPSGGGQAHSREARQALDQALALAGRLDAPAREGEGAGSGQARLDLARLKALIARARDCLEAPPTARQSPREAALKVVAAVVSSDRAVEAILRESLESAGIRVAGGQGPYTTGASPADARGATAGQAGNAARVAVVFWRGAPEVLERRLRAMGCLPWVLVRPLSDKSAPRLDLPPSAVLDMPYRIGELARAVTRLASGGNNQGKAAAGSFF